MGNTGGSDGHPPLTTSRSSSLAEHIVEARQ
jgi:hypothetical protein